MKGRERDGKGFLIVMTDNQFRSFWKLVECSPHNVCYYSGRAISPWRWNFSLDRRARFVENRVCRIIFYTGRAGYVCRLRVGWGNIVQKKRYILWIFYDNTGRNSSSNRMDQLFSKVWYSKNVEILTKNFHQKQKWLQSFVHLTEESRLEVRSDINKLNFIPSFCSSLKS